MTFPRVLVIDDQFGGSFEQRHNLCKAYHLRDTTGDDPNVIEVDAPIADAVFCSAQRRTPDRVENSVDLALDAARAGWPNVTGIRWALCLLDLRFVSGPCDDHGAPVGTEDDDNFGLA